MLKKFVLWYMLRLKDKQCKWHPSCNNCPYQVLRGFESICAMDRVLRTIKN